MKATAFAPGHISGFFEPVYEQDMARTGSRGAGLSISLGAMSEVFAGHSTKQDFDVYINNKKSNAPVTKLALGYLIGDNPIKVVVKTKYDLPFGQGFGMSAACALSATYALSKTVNLSQLPDAQAPLFLQPRGNPFIVVEQDLQLIICLYFESRNVKILNESSKNLKGKYTQYC